MRTNGVEFRLAMRHLTLLLFCGLLFAQVSPGQAIYPVEVLTDTRGVDFTPYLIKVKSSLKKNWYALIPQPATGKKGRVIIEFFILKDGSVTGLKTFGSSGDPMLDRPAFGSVTLSSPFSPLPAEFKGPSLGLRIDYWYNLFDSFIAPARVKVAAGQSQQFSTTITESADKTVLWSVGGKGCQGKDCGTISATGLYTAPETVPDPPLVTVTATMASDPLKTSDATVEIAKPSADLNGVSPKQ
jgi:TonB family protein